MTQEETCSRFISLSGVIEFLSAANFEHHLELRAALLAPAAFNIFIKAT